MNGMRVGFCAGIIEPKVRSVPHSHLGHFQTIRSRLVLGCVIFYERKVVQHGLGPVLWLISQRTYRVTSRNGEYSVHFTHSPLFPLPDSPRISGAGRKVKRALSKRVMWLWECTSKATSPARPSETSRAPFFAGYRQGCVSKFMIFVPEPG